MYRYERHFGFFYRNQTILETFYIIASQQGQQAPHWKSVFTEIFQ